MTLLPYNPIHVNINGLGCPRFARRYSGDRKNLLPDRNGRTHHAKRDGVQLLVISFEQLEFCFGKTF